LALPVRSLTWALPGVMVVTGAAVLLLWPLHANGLSGTAARPHYSAFGWAGYAPLPTHPTPAVLREAGVTLPSDVVVTRRRQAAAVGGAGLALAAAGVVAARRPGS
jgi:hypothetical protein